MPDIPVFERMNWLIHKHYVRKEYTMCKVGKERTWALPLDEKSMVKFILQTWRATFPYALYWNTIKMKHDTVYKIMFHLKVKAAISGNQYKWHNYQDSNLVIEDGFFTNITKILKCECKVGFNNAEIYNNISWTLLFPATDKRTSTRIGRNVWICALCAGWVIFICCVIWLIN